MRFSHLAPDGTELAAVAVIPLWSGVFGLKLEGSPEKTLRLAAKDWCALIQKAKGSAVSQKARELQCRVEDGPALKALRRTLPALDFVRRHDRVEYRTPLDELPDEAGTPLEWGGLRPAGPWTIEEAARLLSEASLGDPDSDPAEDVLSNLRGYLADPELTNGPECVQVGLLGGQPAAVVVAQVKASSGWSRITYMGVLPSFRGRGLGAWAQRRGFSMLRRQQGKTYHGGTVATNAPMIRLFEKHGCRPLRRLSEWVCPAAALTEYSF